MQLTLIIGEDDFLVTEAAKKIIGDVGPALEVIQSRTSTNEDAQLKDILAADASFSTPPFLDPVKVTWWRDVGFLPSGGKTGPSEAVKRALEKFAKKLASNPLPDNQKFILSGPKLLQTSIFAKTLKPVADIIVYSTEKYARNQLRAAAERVAEYAPDFGLTFAPGALEAFVARVGADTRSLLNELGKLRDYLGADASRVTREVIAEISSPGVGIEPEMWDVTDALGARDAAKLFLALKPFEQQTGFSIFATTILEKFFRQLAELKDADMKGKASEATQGLAPFVAQKNLRFAKNWTLQELRAARARMLLLRERAVSSGGDINALLIITLARICRCSPSPREARSSTR